MGTAFRHPPARDRSEVIYRGLSLAGWWRSTKPIVGRQLAACKLYRPSTIER